MVNPAGEREFTRVTRAIDATLTSGKRVLTGRVRDISLKGVFVACLSGWDAGTECDIVVQAPPIEGPEWRVEAKGSIARSGPDGVAVQFHDLVGLESYWNLRNLILFNAADPEKAEKELEAHVGLHRKE